MKFRHLFTLCILIDVPWLAGCGPRSQNSSTAQPVREDSAAPAASPIRFADATGRSGIRFTATSSKTPNKYLIETMGSGCGFIDYDRDGYLDILLLNGAPLAGSSVQGRPTPKLKLYHNNRDGTFTDVTKKAGLDTVMYAMGCAVGDYDNDGYDDIFVSCALGPSHLYHNDHNGHFTDETAKAGVANRGMWGTSCAWVDVDNDGYLDLFVCNYVVYRTLKDDIPCFAQAGRRSYCIPSAFSASHCVLFHNNRNGTFTDISRASGIQASEGKSLGVAVWDYDHDGLPDIYVANDTTPGFLFHNLGNNRFEEVGIQSGIALDDMGNPHSGMGIDVNDLYDKGSSSVVITNYSGQQISLYDQVAAAAYRDNKGPSGVGPPSMQALGFGAGFVDVDNDGHKDLMVVNGHVQDDITEQQTNIRYAEEPFLYHNDGSGKFREVGRSSGEPFAKPIVARALAWGDYDNDGRVDALVTTNNGPAYLWHNETPVSNHWMTLKLTGVKSNRDGIGAVVTVKAGGQTQTTTVRSGSSYLSASDLRAHFGLGKAASAEIEVRWPSGTVDRVADAQADRIWKLTEGAGRLE